jgi:hypothetical protein
MAKESAMAFVQPERTMELKLKGSDHPSLVSQAQAEGGNGKWNVKWDGRMPLAPGVIDLGRELNRVNFLGKSRLEEVNFDGPSENEGLDSRGGVTRATSVGLQADIMEIFNSPAGVLIATGLAMAANAQQNREPRPTQVVNDYDIGEGGV